MTFGELKCSENVRAMPYRALKKVLLDGARQEKMDKIFFKRITHVRHVSSMTHKIYSMESVRDV